MTNIIDLSHKLDSDASYFPGSIPPIISEIHSIQEAGYRESRIQLQSHSGTHVDAPGHILHGGQNLDDFSLNTFTGPGVVIDCSQNVDGISERMLDSQRAALEGVDFILLNTGWSRYWGKEEYLRDFPILTPKACQYIIGLKIKGIGIDCISVDPLESSILTCHNLLLSSGLLIYENLTNLSWLLGKRFKFIGFPLPIENSDGSPVRAVAQIMQGK